MNDEIETIQRENVTAFIGRKVWAVVELPNGNFGVYQQTFGSVFPMTDYPTLRKATARLLQLLGTGPVAPQTWPESICIGHVVGAPGVTGKGEG